MKKCTKCGIEKDDNKFHKNKKHRTGLTSCCKKCQQRYDRVKTLRVNPNAIKKKEKNARPGYKYCSKCGAERSVSDFMRRSDARDGLASNCKFCRYKHTQNNRLYIADKQKQYYQKNINRLRKQNKQYREQNKQYLNEYNRQYSKNHRELINEYTNNRYRINVNFKLSVNLRGRLRAAIKNNHKTGSAVRDLGCTIEELKIYLESQFEEGMTWDNWGRGDNCWHIDHIKPFYMFDLTDREQLLEVCHYTNLRPMWEKDNLTRTYEEFKQ